MIERREVSDLAARLGEDDERGESRKPPELPVRLIPGAGAARTACLVSIPFPVCVYVGAPTERGNCMLGRVPVSGISGGDGAFAAACAAAAAAEAGEMPPNTFGLPAVRAGEGGMVCRRVEASNWRGAEAGLDPGVPSFVLPPLPPLPLFCAFTD